MVAQASRNSSVRVPLLRYRAGKDRLLGGIDATSLLRHAQLEPDKADLAQDENILLLTSNVDLMSDESHGLGGEPLRRGFASIGLRVMASTGTLGDAFGALGRYFASASSVFTLHVETSGRRVRVRLDAKGQDERSALMLEDIWLNSIYAFVCWIVGRQIPVLEATTRDPDLLSVNRVQHAAGEGLKCGPEHSFVIPRECLDWPNAVSNVAEPLWEAMHFWIRQQEATQAQIGMATLPVEPSLPARLRLGDAGSAGVSERQLRRQFRQANGRSFRGARAQAIMHQAENLLRNTDEPIEAIGAKLGYQEERSFRRFVKAQTGSAPTEIRLRGPLLAAPPSADVSARIRMLMRRLHV